MGDRGSGLVKKLGEEDRVYRETPGSPGEGKRKKPISGRGKGTDDS